MKKILLFLFVTLVSLQSKSQVIESDATKFLEAYFSPLGQSFGAGLNNGWYNTAKPHKLGGFDLTFTLNAVSIPNDMQHFDPNNIDNFSSNSTTPTILGAGEGSEITYNNNGNSMTFNMPNQGTLKKSLIPIPILNAGIGLIKKTELDFRYIPTYNYDLGFTGKGSVALWGIGVKHDLLQWIPVIGNAIPVSLSLQTGYTQLNTSFSVVDPNSSVNQDVSLDINATTINLIVSKKLLMITAYAGLGYNSSVTKFSSETSFNVGTSTNPVTMNIPVEMKFESQNEMRANIGLRFNLAIIALQANHTFSKYPVTTIGAGISLR
jgi:hypothetical protein|tara:strand:- start:2086 stop:3048 length:963 start_codon:yes stop_codon:yes gene_type:complete